MFCKAINIIAEIQRVGNPERLSKLQNSSAKISWNSRKTFAKKKIAWVLGSAFICHSVILGFTVSCQVTLK